MFKPEEDNLNYQDVIVKKPWGYEYLMYENGTVGIWYLYLNSGGKTSLHCHPRKKTGLILLSGEAKVSFLNDSLTLKPLNKFMIRPGLFHSTEAISSEGAIVIEVETPCDKTNLVRLEDEYGREEKPYEGSESIVPMPEDCIQLNHPSPGTKVEYRINNSLLCVEVIEDITQLKQRPQNEVIVVLEGELVSNTGESVLSAGDVVSINTINRLSAAFSAPMPISLLTIK